MQCQYVLCERQCEQIAKMTSNGKNMCHYHGRGAKQLYADAYLDTERRMVVYASKQKPKKGDIKYEWGDIYRFCGTWRKCCKVCWRFARPIYCRHHDPENPVHSNNSSYVSCKCLDHISAEIGKEILHRHADISGGMFSGYEYNIPGTSFSVDGYVPDVKTVYEFLGDYWHGNPVCFEPEYINTFVGKTCGELFTNTMLRLQDISRRGYIVYYIWERDYKNYIYRNGKNKSGIQSLLNRICHFEKLPMMISYDAEAEISGKRRRNRTLMEAPEEEAIHFKYRNKSVGKVCD